MNKVQKCYGYLRIFQDEKEMENSKKDILAKFKKLNLDCNIEMIQETKPFLYNWCDWQKRDIGELINKMDKGDIIILDIIHVGLNSIDTGGFVSNCLQKGLILYMPNSDITVDYSIEFCSLNNALGMNLQLEREKNGIFIV